MHSTLSHKYKLEDKNTWREKKNRTKTLTAVRVTRALTVIAHVLCCFPAVCVCVSLDTEVLVLEKLQQNFDLLLHTEASERVKNTRKPAESRTSASAESKTSRQIIHNTHTRRARASEQLNRRVWIFEVNRFILKKRFIGFHRCHAFWI